MFAHQRRASNSLSAQRNCLHCLCTEETTATAIDMNDVFNQVAKNKASLNIEKRLHKRCDKQHPTVYAGNGSICCGKVMGRYTNRPRPSPRPEWWLDPSCWHSLTLLSDGLISQNLSLLGQIWVLQLFTGPFIQ